jgi:hypothetical protein
LLFFQNNSGPGTGRSAIPENKMKEALIACRKFKLDTISAIFINMAEHPGKHRLWLIDLHTGRVLRSALCCHGMGGGSTELSPVFSNTKNSNCTSLGMYRTGIRAPSRYGINIHYKLHGLEKTNNNAFDRIVVLHSYSPVPEQEIYPSALPMGWSLGCPVTSNGMMKTLDSLFQKKKNNTLLWIYH